MRRSGVQFPFWARHHHRRVGTTSRSVIQVLSKCVGHCLQRERVVATASPRQLRTDRSATARRGIGSAKALEPNVPGHKWRRATRHRCRGFDQQALILVDHTQRITRSMARPRPHEAQQADNAAARRLLRDTRAGAWSITSLGTTSSTSSSRRYSEYSLQPAPVAARYAASAGQTSTSVREPCRPSAGDHDAIMSRISTPSRTHLPPKVITNEPSNSNGTSPTGVTTLPLSLVDALEAAVAETRKLTILRTTTLTSNSCPTSPVNQTNGS